MKKKEKKDKKERKIPFIFILNKKTKKFCILYCLCDYIFFCGVGGAV